jgi:DNA-binding transcriptional LysR family regulator
MSAFSKELRSFVVVAHSGSIRAAAEKLNISAPALSRQIKILEYGYGTKLFIRSSAGVVLSAEGEELRAAATEWLAADVSLSKHFHRDQKQADLRLRIGTMASLADTWVPMLMDRLEKIFDKIELDLIIGSTSEIVERAEAHELDVAVAFNLPKLTSMIVSASKDYHLGVVCAPGYGPVGEGPISLNQALDYPLCLPSSALSMHTRLIGEILSVRVSPDVHVMSNSVPAILHFLQRGRGLGFLTWPDVAQHVERGQLVFRPLAVKRLTETLSTAICRGNALGASTPIVMKAIQSTLSDLGE